MHINTGFNSEVKRFFEDGHTEDIQ